MTEDGNTPEAGAADAMAAISRAGRRRQRASRRMLALAVGTAVAMAVVAAWALFWSDTDTGPQLAVRRVALLLPETTPGGAVADNAALQWQGFEAAYKQHQVATSGQFFEHFEYPLSPTGSADIVEHMRTWYAQGVRTFIITMSGAVGSVKKPFIAWRNSIEVADDRPVLIATVASAPEIADAANGVFRHYVRSRDESDVLAGYVEAHDATEVFVFYVKDAYGITAKEILLRRVADANVDTFAVPVAFVPAAAQALREDVQTVQHVTTSGANAVVIIIGYGGMIQEAVLSLQNVGFAGRTLVVSTFTEKQWRPSIGPGNGELNSEFAQRVYTIAPVISGRGKTTGVVTQFTYLTLDRALLCQNRRGAIAFHACWHEGAGSPAVNALEIPAVDVEFTQHGDSHVSLRLLPLLELAQ